MSLFKLSSGRVLALCLSILLVSGNSKGQWSFDEIYGSALKIGDSVPEIVLDESINLPKNAKLSDYKGKLVILDLWSTSCSSCIALFPHMTELQKKYEGKIQILLVNVFSKYKKDSLSKILRSLSIMQRRTGVTIDLPVVYNNKRLDSLLPPVGGVPTEIWIDKDGKLIGITRADEVNETNIEAVIAGNNTHLRMEKATPYDPGIPVSVSDKQILRRSLITRAIPNVLPGVKSVEGEDIQNEKWTRFFINHRTPHMLYTELLDKFFGLDNINRAIFEGKDPAAMRKKFVEQPTDPDSLYAIEVICPPTEPRVLKKQMVQDLDNYFGVHSSVEKRKVKCLVIAVQDSNKIRFSKTEEQEEETNLFDKVNRMRYVKNTPLHFLAQYLNGVYSTLVIDETGIKRQVDLELGYTPADLTSLQKALSKSGLTITETERELEMMVYREVQ